MNWLYIIIAGLFETGFTLCLGKAQESTGRESLYWWMGFLACLAISMYLMFRAVSGIGALPIGSPYAIWTGIGPVGGVLVGIFIFREPATFWRLFFVSTLIGSIAGLKFFSE